MGRELFGDLSPRSVFHLSLHLQRFFKSAANVDPGQQEQRSLLLPADKRASTARSENCILITVAEDLDYDDLASAG